ncbi:MAG: glycosyltransferase, partial [Microcystaceae cyanobacterium]
NRYIRGLRSWVGFRQTAVQFERDPRFAGEVKYTFRKSFTLAINSLISFSKVPLRLSTYLGLMAAALALGMAGLVLYWRLTQKVSGVTGLAAIVIAILFLGSVQLVCLGILGEYIGRIYEEVKGRPLFTVAELGGFEGESPAINKKPSPNNKEGLG